MTVSTETQQQEELTLANAILLVVSGCLDEARDLDMLRLEDPPGILRRRLVLELFTALTGCVTEEEFSELQKLFEETGEEQYPALMEYVVEYHRHLHPILVRKVTSAIDAWGGQWYQSGSYEAQTALFDFAEGLDFAMELEQELARELVFSEHRMTTLQ